MTPTASLAAVLLLIAGGCIATPVRGAADEPAGEPARKIAALVRQLDADSRQERDQAEQAIVKLGMDALLHLPAPESKLLSAEQRRRLARLLPALWEQKLKTEVAGALVTLPDEPLLLSELLGRIHKQTGIQVADMRERFNQEAVDIKLTVACDKVPFWKALDQLAKAAGFSYYPHNEDRSVGLVGKPAPAAPVSYAGAFRIEAKKLILQTDFDKLRECRLELEMMTEPRLKPLVIDVETDKLKAEDDRGRAIPFTGPKTVPISLEGALYVSTMTLRTDAPQRDASKIARLEGEVGVWLPAQVETLEFPVAVSDKPIQKAGAGVTVELRPVREDDGVWTVPVVIERTLKGQKVESHMQVRMENEIYLQKADGTKFVQNGGLSSIDEPGKTGVELLFTDVPGKMADYKLIVRVPSGVTRLPVKFSFQNLVLP